MLAHVYSSNGGNTGKDETKQMSTERNKNKTVIVLVFLVLI
jgi:hypothetical protein